MAKAKRTNPTVRTNFTKVPNVLFDDPRLRPSERLVVMYVLSFEDCYASLKFIAKQLGYSRSTVQRAMDRLHKMKAIDKIRGGGFQYHYVVRPISDWRLEETTPVSQRDPDSIPF